MHAFITTGHDIDYVAQKEKVKRQIPFQLQKIDDTRELKKLIKFSFSEQTAIIIEDIDKITIEAANAFLKNLEEPTKNIIYILTASNLSNVLPTIISRCEIVRVQDIENRVQLKQLNYNNALNIKDREEAIKFIEELIYFDHEKNIFNNMENYLTTIKNLKANGNVSLQMTGFVVRMNGYGKQI